MTLDIATWFLHRTYGLAMMIVCAKIFTNPTIQEEVVSLTQFWDALTIKYKHTWTGIYKHTWTGKTLYALPPFHGKGGGH